MSHILEDGTLLYEIALPRISRLIIVVPVLFLGDNESRCFAGLHRERGMGYSALSLFSGCGGFCEGVELAGFNIQAAVELDRFACQTYRHNFPRVPLYEGDVRNFLNTPGEDHIRKYRLSGVDLVFGGPPCQGYSQIGTRDLNDDRNKLYEQYARIVETLRPKVFLMENVPNLLLMSKGHFRDLILDHFAEIGYGNVTYVKVSADDFGVPQT